MAESERIPRRTLPVQTCLACGSTWFREATFHQWPAASSAGAKPMTSMLQTMLVCLCGTPVPPRWGGIPWRKDTECGNGSIPSKPRTG